ncbi:TPA: phage terminase small subunit P27 family [Salmonella enterica]|uniref:Phage terminase small subunit P27 family n=1 Tax=Salmonella enterica TaxID=28901 RepID=A0A744JSS5_SALER|nr:phage terminase small subunit P27 family [Salmonella enterica]EBW2365379.1 phage terminase small subunit P27 family [Salmonella enterica subsp. enterica serovar Ajiobo]EDF9815714.1 phage terminase small subunit P27 family [Salmonella enterica subsp. enterica serovar Tennessee]EDU0171275.1 phage terminase small subunit P27 family [Salmonella enterica subsp. enterica serovar Belfast]EDN5728463.1 phage terminase small subunit P27 family [Salmonella enterica subsp. enterica serovar Ajiobo]
MAKVERPPKYLDKVAAAQWKSKAKLIAERGDITPADWSSLELYCVNYSVYRRAVEDIEKQGFSIEGANGGRSRNPALSAKSDAERVLIKMSQLLGFDPVSRRRNPPENDENDGFDDV